MAFIQQHIQSAIKIIEQYKGDVPFAIHLKNIFSTNKKYGSKDRKQIAHICYCYFRLGKSIKNLAVEEQIKIALFLCNEAAGVWSILFNDEWKAVWIKDLQGRLQFVKIKYPSFSVENIFAYQNELSNEIDKKTVAQSHLIQPDLFLRIRPNKEKQVVEKLKAANISFQQLSTTCIALENSTKIDNVLQLDEEAVVQDYSSQRIVEFLKLITYNSQLTTHTWDCCAASGGKSILAKDVMKSINLTVSDVRVSILQNLKKRFEKAGIKKYHSCVVDLSHSPLTIPHSPFQLIICDAPCTGSGTWGRTPEQLHFFSPNKINEYTILQKKIISNTVPQLAKEGYFLYITCSVFKNENEDAVEFIKKEFHLELIKTELLKGYAIKADTMFAALFKRV